MIMNELPCAVVAVGDRVHLVLEAPSGPAAGWELAQARAPGPRSLRRVLWTLPGDARNDFRWTPLPFSADAAVSLQDLAATGTAAAIAARLTGLALPEARLRGICAAGRYEFTPPATRWWSGVWSARPATAAKGSKGSDSSSLRIGARLLLHGALVLEEDGTSSVRGMPWASQCRW